ncbi:hypothetical protein VTH82DRAFT_5564 [Thermothelomyces myriococcoides]
MADAHIHDFPSLFSLEGKVAVVTGGSRGLGLTAASARSSSRAARRQHARRRARRSTACPTYVRGARAVSVPADLSTVEGVRHLVAEVSRRTGHVDVLLANAGATWGEAFDSHPDAAFAKVMDLNVRGVFNLVREFAPLLQRRASAEDPSRVVITASVSGLGVGTLGKQGTYGYSASKAAVIHLGRNLAVELGPRGITVNSICPGFFPTKMSNGLLKMAGGVEAVAKANPMRRLGRPEDIAGVVVYLTSRAGSHVNGAAIEIDGGALWQSGELNVKL